ncbi:MAG: ABC transporter ATP-binding protein [bacterium]
MISLDSVSKVYSDGAVIAVNNVSLEIESGEKLALMGPSGAGKSTLLNLMGTIDSPTSGEIIIDDINLFSIKRTNRFRARTIGFIFQFHHLLPNLTSLENVEMPMYSEKIPRRERRQRAMDLLESVGIGNKFDKLPGQLAGGERQRIAVARALVNNPKIVLADEPTGSLDAKTGLWVIDQLVNYSDANRATLILATHNEAVAKRMNRRIIMEYGSVDFENSNKI